MTPAVEIVHVSDVHLSTQEPSRMQKLIGVQRGSEDVKAALASVVHNLVTRENVLTVATLSGDLSTLGDVNDIGATRAWWQGTAPHSSVYVLGNHDFWNGHPLRTAVVHASVHREVRAAHWPNDTVTVFENDGMRITIYEADTTPSERLTGLVTNVLAQGPPMSLS